MPILGTPYRVVYAAKNYAAGVPGIVARVVKPNNAVLGVYALTPLAPFTGLYYFDLITIPGEPEGEWIAFIESPAEGVKDVHRISFESRITEQLQNIVTFGQALKVKVDTSKLLAKASGPGATRVTMGSPTRLVKVTSAKGQVKAIIKTTNDIEGVIS